MAAIVSREADLTDSLGRKIKIRKLKPSDRMKLSLALGDAAKNEMFLGHAFLAATVTEIDGEKVFAPSNRMEAEILCDRLDDEGLEAVGLAYAELFGDKPMGDAEIEAAKN